MESPETLSREFGAPSESIMLIPRNTTDVLILDESYPSRLLVYKARRLRIKTGNWALHAEFEEWEYVFAGSIAPPLNYSRSGIYRGNSDSQSLFKARYTFLK